MCGIVGYVGWREAAPVLLKGLERLEYRGYDSAGLAVLDDAGWIDLYKCKGKVADLRKFIGSTHLQSTIGIAHTRWATHGEPNDRNAHPHLSNSGELAIIHNGIIENYRTLKDILSSKGYLFHSDTDTEVLINLIEMLRKENDCTLVEAVELALKEAVGAYAIAIIERSHPERIIAARQHSPMAIGIGKDEFFISSDASSIIEYTNEVVYVGDGEIAIIEKGKELEIINLEGVKSNINVQKLQLSISELEKGGYPHFMLKEIHEQPRTITDCIRGRISKIDHGVKLSGVDLNMDKFLNAGRIIFVSCGTSYNASLIGEYLFESMCRIPVEVEYASEFRYRDPIIHKDDIVIAVSQSGETADTLAAIKIAKEAGAFVYGICNVIGSSIARDTDSGTYIHVGPEIGVASTKAFTGQVTVMAMMALAIAKAKGTISPEYYSEVAEAMLALPDQLAETLKLSPDIEQMSKIFTYAHNFIYLGRGYNYPTALEGALKLKEISYIHAEGYPAAEMKHGPIALIDAEMPTVVIATNDHTYEKTLSNIMEVKARKGKIIAIVCKGDTMVKQIADYTIEIPKTVECLMPVISCVPLQLIAYYIAINKGRNVDQPRNLAKAVTVE